MVSNVPFSFKDWNLKTGNEIPGAVKTKIFTALGIQASSWRQVKRITWRSLEI